MQDGSLALHDGERRSRHDLGILLSLADVDEAAGRDALKTRLLVLGDEHLGMVAGLVDVAAAAYLVPIDPGIAGAFRAVRGRLRAGRRLLPRGRGLRGERCAELFRRLDW